MYGLPFSWEPVVATLPCHYHDIVLVWSPCNKFIAITGHSAPRIDIVDAVTLKQLSTFESPQHHNGQHKWLSFSPDSCLLTQFSNWELTSWDLQTGCSVSSIPTVDQSFCHGISSTYSTDGKMIAVAARPPTLYRNLLHDCVIITTYNLLSRAHVYSYSFQKSNVIPPIWTHGNYIRFATVAPGSISIWEVGFNSVSTLAEVETLTLPDKIHSSEGIDILFLPTLTQLAFTLEKKVLIWDAQGSNLLLDRKSVV